MRDVTHKWTIAFSGCDRRQLYRALRDTGLQNAAEQAVANSNPVFDDDPDSPVNTGIEISSLSDLFLILNSTLHKVLCDFGVALYCYWEDGKVASGTVAISVPLDHVSGSSATVHYRNLEAGREAREQLSIAAKSIGIAMEMINASGN